MPDLESSYLSPLPRRAAGEALAPRTAAIDGFVRLAGDNLNERTYVLYLNMVSNVPLPR